MKTLTIHTVQAIKTLLGNELEKVPAIHLTHRLVDDEYLSILYILLKDHRGLADVPQRVTT